ncbi:MAG TPA: VCBS repeat-containing protein [Thermoanaerobaculia bacterium]|jgi:hypothetical protein|nr:VCBS repeat-containing protein [Thermoanaerobaculia bacterium]
MQSTSRFAPRLIPALLLIAAALSWASPGLAATAAAPKKPSAKTPKAATPAPAATAAPAADAKTAPAAGAAVADGPQPPNGKWLTDKEGRQYFVDKLQKEGMRYLRVNDKVLRTAWGINVDLVKEDDKFFYYKVYRQMGGAGPVAGPQAGVKPEEVQKIAATYQVDTLESQLLKFVPFSTGLPNRGQWRNGFDIADMNGDGHPDIVHSAARKEPGPPVIFIGDGKGNWRRWSEARFPRLPYDYGDAAVGDFNGDGHPDIALGAHLRGLMALLGDGKGGFTEAGKGLDFVLPGQGRQPGYSSRTITVADWNHDGRPDILAVGEGPRLNVVSRDQARPSTNTESYGVIVYLNQGNGTWLRKDQGTSNREIFSDSIVTGDFNGDRRLDFATGSSIQGRKSLVNYGREDGGWNAMDVDVHPRSYVRSVDAADLDGDGLDDLLVGYMSYEGEAWRNGIDILYARKDGTWARRVLAAAEQRVEVSALAHGDLDGDGKLDLVALTGNGATWVFHGDGKGFFTRETTTGIPPFVGGCTGYYVRLADLDGDGKDEIVADFAGESSAMFDPDRCPSGGGLQAWHLAPAGAPAAGR